MPVTRNECARCGTCCRKGGPGLHIEDKRLLEEKVLEPGDLVCFRKGEFAFDQAGQCLAPLDQELLKIRGKEDGWECLFYDPSTRGCLIYGDRPLECRTLMCWDTGPIEEVMGRDDRLTRLHLVPGDSGLGELIREHESRCGLGRVRAITEKGDVETRALRQEILDLCFYELSFREAISQKTGTPDNVLECYFGRPLFRAVRGYDPWFGSDDFLGYFSG